MHYVRPLIASLGKPASATDWIDEAGLTLAESVEVARELKQHGVDLIDASSGGNVSDVRVPVGPGYQVPQSEAIHHSIQIPTGTVGLITEPTQANDILEHDQADLIIMARELLRNPRWPQHAAQELSQDIEWPKQYVRAKN